MTDRQLEHIATEMRTRGDARAPNLRGVIVRAREESLMESSGQGNDPGDLSSAALVALRDCLRREAQCAFDFASRVGFCSHSFNAALS